MDVQLTLFQPSNIKKNIRCSVYFWALVILNLDLTYMFVEIVIHQLYINMLEVNNKWRVCMVCYHGIKSGKCRNLLVIKLNECL
jgi:hypothetical protein